MARDGGAYWQTYGTRLAVLAVGFLVGIVSARDLGPAGRGLYAVTVTSAGLIVQLANFGLSSAVLYFVSRRTRRAGAFLAVAWTGGSILLVICVSVYGILRAMGVGSTLYLLIVLWAPVQLTSLLQEKLFLGLAQFTRFNSLQLGNRVLGLITALLAAMIRAGSAEWFIASQLIADSVATITGALLLFETGVRFGRVPLGPVARLAGRAAPVLVIPFLLVRSDILLMEGFRTSAETGLYAVAAQLIDVLLLLPTTFAQILFVSLSKSSNLARETVRVSRRVLGLLVALAVVMAVAGPWVLPLVFGRRFTASYPPLLALLPGGVVLGLQTIVAQYFAVKAYPRFLTMYWVIGFVLNFGINLYVIPRFGGVGAALSSTVSYGLVGFLVMRRFARATGFPARSLLGSALPQSAKGT